MKAYALISIRTGEVREVIRQLKKDNAVKESNMTFGPFDAIAILEAKDINDLGPSSPPRFNLSLVSQKHLTA